LLLMIIILLLSTIISRNLVAKTMKERLASAD
jgi:hypothetical protein